MSLHINSREHLKQRQEVKPLTMEEEEDVIDLLNSCSLLRDEEHTIQRLIYLYENYKHFFIISQSKSDNMEVQYEIVESKMNDNE